MRRPYNLIRVFLMAGLILCTVNTDLLGHVLFFPNNNHGCAPTQASDSTALDISVIWYVKKGSNGNGSSWQNAFPELQDALKKASPGDQIWVARGTYLPTRHNDRNASFEIKSGIRLYGGFMGNESDLRQRDWKKNPCILSGEIASSSTADNSFSVIKFRNASAKTILDGFTIEAGEANAGDRVRQPVVSKTEDPNTNTPAEFKEKRGKELANSLQSESMTKLGMTIRQSIEMMFQEGINENKEEEEYKLVGPRPKINNPNSCGAGIFNEAKGANSNPTIVNCRFIDNHAFYGGAIFNYSSYDGTCKPLIENCEFIRNVASLDGGAIYNAGKQGNAIPIIKNSTFRRNGANYGAVAFSEYSKSCDQVPLFLNCYFTENAAFTRGKVHYDGYNDNFCSTTMSRCTFENNSSGIGGDSKGVYNIFYKRK